MTDNGVILRASFVFIYHRKNSNLFK